MYIAVLNSVLYLTMWFIFLFKELEVFHGQTLRLWPSSTRGGETRCSRSWEECTELDTFSPSYPTVWPPRASPEHQSSAKQGWKGSSQISGNATKTSMYAYSRKSERWSSRILFWFTVCICSLLIPRCSMKGQEQVECKFYNELGRILVKDFPSLPQSDETPGEPEDSDFPSFSHQDIGKLKCSLLTVGAVPVTWTHS